MAWLSRFVVALAFLAVGFIFRSSESNGPQSPSLSTTLTLFHLLCFSTAFGAALWVTFIGGIIMFKNLPRHQFGNLQSKMFPAYFTMVGVCCAICVADFGYLHPWKSSSINEKYQLGFLGFAFLFNLSNLVIFTPMTIESFKRGLGANLCTTLQLGYGAKIFNGFSCAGYVIGPGQVGHSRCKCQSSPDGLARPGPTVYQNTFCPLMGLGVCLGPRSDGP